MSTPKRKKAYNIDELRSKGLDNQETFLKLTKKWNSETRTGWDCDDYGIFTYYKNGVESIDSQLGFSHIQFDEDKVNVFYSANRLIASDPVFPEQVAYVEYDLKNNKQASFWWCPTLGLFLQTKDLWKITKNKEEYKSLVGMPHGEDGVHLSFLSKETKLEHNPYGPASYCDWEFFPKYYFNGRLCKSKAEWQRKIAAKNKKTSTKRDEAAILMEQNNKPELQVLELKSGEIRPDNYTGIIKYSDGDKIWYLNGKRHREDGPAIEWSNGTKDWYLNGKLHREDGPACEYTDGTKFWYLNDKSYSEADWKIAVEKLKKERAEASMKKETNNKPELQVLEPKVGELIPDNFTGIVKHPDSTKQWYLNGKYHRVDGPACEHPSGEKHWFLKGERHREDGPAIEYPGGSKYWYLNGKCYSKESEWKIAMEKLKKERTEASMKKETNKKPELQVLEPKAGERIPDNFTGIVKYSDGTKKWYLNGKRHREDGPAVEWSDGTKEWYLNGKLHREDGPAVEDADGSKEWWLNNQRHRVDGPAIEWANGSKHWFLKGERHREDGPAIEYYDGEKQWWLNGDEYTETDWKIAVEKLNKERAEASMKKETSNKPEFRVLEPMAGELIPSNYTGIVKYSDGSREWYLNGLYHREDGPAVEWANGTKYWYLNDKRHREDGPACEYTDGTKFWYLNDKSYSEADWKVAVEELNKERAEASMKKETNNKPELQVLEPKAGELIPDNFTGIIKYSDGTKKWYLNGNRHREDGPAIERADGTKEWRLDDKRHRVDGPAVEWADGQKEWWLNNQRHRVDGPAVERDDGSKEWWLDDKRHREDGPAYEDANGRKYWYLNGKCYSNESKWKDAVEELNKERAGERKENTSPVIETSQHSPGTVCQHRMLMDCVSSKPTVMQSIKTTAKKDFNAVAVRVAADKLSDVVQVALIAVLKKALDNKTTNQIDKFLSSKQGKVFIKMMVGIIVPMMIQKFPERFQGILEAVSTESRIQAEVHIASTMVDSIGEFITPMLGHFAQSMEAMEDSSTGVRVFVEQTNLAATSKEESIGETINIQSGNHLVS